MGIARSRIQATEFVFCLFSLTEGRPVLLQCYNCSWPSSAQRFSSPSPAGLMTIFYSLRFETPPHDGPGTRIYTPPGTRWLRFTPGNWVKLNSPWSPPTTLRVTLRYSKLPPQGFSYSSSLYSPSTERNGKKLNYCVFFCCRRKNVSIELFHSKGHCIVSCFCNVYKSQQWKSKLRGLSSRANNTDRAKAACLRS
jgi:hypothetical protein